VFFEKIFPPFFWGEHFREIFPEENYFFSSLKRELVFSKTIKKKKIAHKKNSSKKMEQTILKKNKNKFLFRVKMFFGFSKKEYFSQRKSVSKLSVFENRHFWLCPQISIT
jgi:hypothetical protein